MKRGSAGASQPDVGQQHRLGRTHRTDEVDLRSYRDPRSIAVIGASVHEAKWGHWLARGALAGAHRRQVFLVNHRVPNILGVDCYAQIADCPEVPELVVICVPPNQVGRMVDEALAFGARSFLCVTTPVPQQDELAATIRAAGGRLIGPNSLGLVDTSTDLILAWGHFVAGPLAVISQSGQLGTEIAGLGSTTGLGISRFVSVGNQVDVSAADLLADLLTHSATRVVALYLENFSAAQDVLPVLQDLRAAGKRVLLLTVGGSAGSSRLAISHTGSITSELDEIDAFCRAAAALRVRTPGELIDVARVIVTGRPLQRGRVAVLGDSGGQCGVAADVLAAEGVPLPVLSAPLQRRLASRLPVGASCSNPVDLAGAGESDLGTYAAVAELLLSSGEIDIVVLTGYFGMYGVDTPGLTAAESMVAAALADLVAATGGQLLVHSMAAQRLDESPALRELQDGGVPVYPQIEALARGLAGSQKLSRATARRVVLPEFVEGALPDGYWATRKALAANRIALPQALVAEPDGEFGPIRMSAPYVLKADWIAHKTEQAAVVLGLSEDRVVAAHEEMVGRLGRGRYVLEEQDTRSHVVEMLIGFRNDSALGPLITVGAGGTYAEMYADSVVELAPVDLELATDMINRLRCAPALRGWRGGPALAVADLAAMIVAVSRFGSARADIAELELNPVRVGQDRALAVDALIARGTAATPAREVSPVVPEEWIIDAQHQ